MLIVLEGLDGAGKSTQISLLRSFFEKDGAKVNYLHFPRFDSPIYGEMIAKFLRGDFGPIESVHPHIVALLFALDRQNASPLIKSWLDEGRHVILDRYVYSNIAFQCAKLEDRDSKMELRDWIMRTEFEEYGIPKPDVNIFLDVPIGFVDKKLSENRLGEERDYLKGKRDIHESDIMFQKRVREVYLEQAELDSSFVRIDCGTPEGEMLPAELIFEKIESIINIRNKVR